MVRNYTDKELLAKVKSLPSFNGIPRGYWLLGIKPKVHTSDTYDSKFYLFLGEQFIMVTSGTANPGSWGLKNFMKYNTKGCAVVKSEEWYYNLWANGLHKGKMDAGVQVSNILYYRDNNNNLQPEEVGEVYRGIIGINFHTCTYQTDKNFISAFIGKIIGQWSEGCQLANVGKMYYQIRAYMKTQTYTTYCLIKEF